MQELSTPTPWDIKKALEEGANAADIDELFYPGEKSRCIIRKSRYPVPEGTGRDRWRPETRRVIEFKHDQFAIGVRERTSLYKGEFWIGYIDEVRRGMCNIFYRTHDGEEFAHWGGPEGAESYLIDRYWLYGNPPEPKKSMLEVLKVKKPKTKKETDVSAVNNPENLCEKNESICPPEKEMKWATKRKVEGILFIRKLLKLPASEVEESI